MIPQEHEIAGIRFTPFPIAVLVFCWVCGRCSAVIADSAVHAGHHDGEDQITRSVRRLMDEMEKRS